jgi:2-keto-3-deoxy-L-rhamnonate aldolase RhmA
VPSAQPQRDADGDRLPPVYTREGAERLARDPLLDYLFLNLEGDYDATAVDALVAGLATVSPPERPALLVRIPSIERDGEQAARERVRDALGRGADGIVLPHVRNAEEARIAVRFFEEAEADVWSPANPDGRIIAMLMIEDPNALETAQAIADTPGYSMLSCGIGSLTAALGGDRDAGEAGADVVRHHAARVGLPSMMTANPANMLDRLNQGYRALLLQMGDETVDAIRLGRRMAGR